MKKEGTKICKHCKSEIPVDAKVCPNCRKKQGMKIWQIILIAIVVIGMISAFAGSGSDEPTSTANNSKSSETTEKEEQKKEFTQNETVTYKGVNYSITNVTKSAGTEFDIPKEGHEYVIVTIKIENNGSEKISYNPLDWKMENSNGQEEATIFTTIDSDTALSSGDLNAGGVKEGTIAFEEPTGDSRLKLNYYANSLLDEEASFKIKLN